MGIFERVGREQQRLNSKMILSLVSSVLVASMVQAAPGASSYGGPAKQIASPPSIQCRTEYVTLWDTEYQEREEQVCKTVYEKQCSTRTQRLCQPTTRQECTTEYANECSTICKNVSEQKCVSVPRQVCVTVPDQVCTSEPLTECQDVPRQQCHSEHKRFPIRVSRQEPKKVCDEAQVHAPLAVPVHHQQPSVQDLLSYGVPAVPAQAAPEIILERDKQKLQNAAMDELIVFA